MQPIPTPPKSRGFLGNNVVATLFCAGIGVVLGLGGWSVAQSALTRVGLGEMMGGEYLLAEERQAMTAKEIEQALETRPEFQVFLKEMERAILESDRLYLRDVVDEAALMRRILERAPQTHEGKILADLYRSGTLESWRKGGVLESFAGGHYRYLRPRTIDGRTGVLFRLAEDGDLVNYHLHEIVESGGGYKIADTYILGLKESLSDTLWRGLGHLLAEVHPEVAPGSDAEGSMAFVKSIRAIGQLSRSLANERYQEALDIYSSMPLVVQQVRDVLLMRIEAAAKLSPLELDEALDQWKGLGYKEEELPLKFIDYHMARGHYEVARDSAVMVSEIVGGEPYLRARIGELNFAIENQGSARSRHRGGAPRARRAADNSVKSLE